MGLGLGRNTVWITLDALVVFPSIVVYRLSVVFVFLVGIVGIVTTNVYFINVEF